MAGGVQCVPRSLEAVAVLADAVNDGDELPEGACLLLTAHDAFASGADCDSAVLQRDMMDAASFAPGTRGFVGALPAHCAPEGYRTAQFLGLPFVDVSTYIHRQCPRFVPSAWPPWCTCARRSVKW